MPNIYQFDHDHVAQWGKSPKDLKDLLGGKGANLAEMTTILNLPVPHGFTITTDACRDFLASGWSKALEDEIYAAVADVEAKMARKFGAQSGMPLLLSVRSGAKFSMPGMMDTVLNLGLNDKTVLAMAEAFGSRRFAWDSYRRFIAMYGRIVHGLDAKVFDEIVQARVDYHGGITEENFVYDDFHWIAKTSKDRFKEITGKPFPSSVKGQLIGAIKAVFESWNGERAFTYREVEGIPHDIGTAVNVQAMVFGNQNDNSGTGVAFTRNPVTGEATPYGDFLIKAQGEDVVAGTHKTQPLNTMTVGFNGAYQQLQDIFSVLEKHYEDMCDVEFTIENTTLWILQTRVGKRADAAALRMAVEMSQSYFTKGWAIPRAEALGRVKEIVDNAPTKKVVETSVDEELVHIAQGLAASPGSATGKAVFTADMAVKYVNNGDKVILVREETSPDDIHGMQVSQGILTQKGGLVSHAAVVARGWNIPAVVGADDIKIDDHAARFETKTGLVINNGDTITIDGSTGKVYPGNVKIAGGDNDSNYLEILRSWSKKVSA